ncbi:hypothetical protein [Pontibacter saemangeumensis]|uniref:hypothetical protein n=1 Tax=Pontibacter saemangeumensis TaxID=1084525 RepID=UPI0031E5B485
MKRLLHHTVPLLLALCVLLGSVGIALTEQLCLMTGLRTVEVLAHAGESCGKNCASAGEDCCSVEVSYTKVATVAAQKAALPALPVLLPAAGTLHGTPWLYRPGADQRLPAYSNSSPPLYGRSLLHRLQVLIV